MRVFDLTQPTNDEKLDILREAVEEQTALLIGFIIRGAKG